MLRHRQNESNNVTSGAILSVLGTVAALLISVSLLLMGNGLQMTLIPVRGSLENFLGYEIGILGSAYFIGLTLGCLLGPLLIGRAGHIRTYLAMVSAASVVVLLHGLLIEPAVWWLLRAISGFCFAVLFIVIESWLNERCSNDTRGTIFSIYIAINLTVISAGQTMVGLDDPKSFSLFALSSILVSLASIPVAFTTAIVPAAIPTVWPQPSKLYRTSPVGFVGCLAVGSANGAFWTLGPVFAQDKGFDTAGIGFFMGATVLGGALAQWPLGWLSDRTDRRHAMLLAAFLALTSASAIIVYAGTDRALLLIFAATFGMGAFPLYALSVAHANDHANPKDYVEVSSGLLLVFGIGASVGPLAAGVMRQAMDEPTLFLFTSVIHILLIAFIVWRISRRKAPAEGERVDFRDALVASETAMPLEAKASLNKQ